MTNRLGGNDYRRRRILLNKICCSPSPSEYTPVFCFFYYFLLISKYYSSTVLKYKYFFFIIIIIEIIIIEFFITFFFFFFMNTALSFSLITNDAYYDDGRMITKKYNTLYLLQLILASTTCTHSNSFAFSSSDDSKATNKYHNYSAGDDPKMCTAVQS